MDSGHRIEEIFTNVFKVDGRLATRSIAPGTLVYGEETVVDGKDEYRIWNPYRSKLAAAILKGMHHFYFKRDSKVLYLGAATGTTCSHVSDIVDKGTLNCIEISERSMRELLKVCEKRENMFPFMGDARNVEAYADDVGSVEIIYQDISARDQADILLRNSALLHSGGKAYVAIKSQSIDISKKPKEVYDKFISDVSSVFKLVEKIDIMPYDKMHMFVVMEKKAIK